MPIKLPPPKGKAGQTQQAAFRAFITSHKGLAPYAQQIYRAAQDYGLDPVYFAALIWFESKGNPKAVSSADARGLGQIHAPTWLGKRDPRTGKTITAADIANPVWNLGFSAWYFAQGVNKHGSYDAAYRQGYNPGYTGAGPFASVPKGYVPTGTARSPEQQAQRAVETATAKQALVNPYVRITAKGKLVYTDNPAAPGVLRFGGAKGPPVTQADFFNIWRRELDPTFLAYSGRRATLKEVAQYIRTGKTLYQVQVGLAGKDSFYGSPVWKQSAPSYKSIVRQMFGQEGYDPESFRGMIGYAIVHNLTGEAFADYLRQQPSYVQSLEFKGNSSALGNIFRQIYGEPDENANVVIGEAARSGWTADQFASYLRSQPGYIGSQEYQGKALAFLDAMGLMTGARPTIAPGAPRPQQTPGQPGPPNSGVVPGTPDPLAPPSNLVPTL